MIKRRVLREQRADGSSSSAAVSPARGQKGGRVLLAKLVNAGYQL